MVDPERLLARLERMREQTLHLRDQAALGAEALLTDPLQLDAAKYRLVVAVEAAIDAAEHVIASEGLRRPSSYADAFSSLAEAGVLPVPVAETACRMAGMRNLLVHDYAEVDDARVVDVLLLHLDDLDALRRSLAQLAL